MTKDIVLWTGAGQIGMAIARQIGFNKKIIVGDKNLKNAQDITKIMTNAGFDIEPVKCNISSRESILNMIKTGQIN